MEYIKRYTLFTGFYKINFSCIIMPQDILTDLNNLDLNKPTVDIEAIRTVIPHRYEMEQLNGIIKFDPENKIIIGYKDISNSEFWVRGHIPGRPLMPGVIMLEAAAQLCTYYYKKSPRTTDSLASVVSTKSNSVGKLSLATNSFSLQKTRNCVRAGPFLTLKVW